MPSSPPSPPTGAEPALTLASEHRDFVEWRRGRRRDALWAIATPDFEPALTELRQPLADYLLPDYRRQAHVTVYICGFPGGDGASMGAGDDFSAAAFAAQVAALRAARLQPFTLSLGAPDSFSAAAYVALGDEERGVARLRQALAGAGTGSCAGANDAPFVAHLTIGLYRARFALSDVRQRLRALPATSATTVAVDRLLLMSYDAAVISGPLLTICAFDLARQSLRVIDAAAFGELSAPSCAEHST
jgi:2'-5' RNA ligase